MATTDIDFLCGSSRANLNNDFKSANDTLDRLF